MSVFGFSVHYQLSVPLTANDENHDRRLLGQFVATGSSAAFAELTKRYSPMVYAAARRQTRDEHVAEDVTQAVFVLLSQRAATILGPLAGWLLTTTRFAALNATKLERRRQHHERIAARMRNEASARDVRWNDYVDELDTSMECLPRNERDCIAMRFFRGLSLNEIAETLGISPAAAQKRVNRSLMLLRQKMATSAAAVPTAVVLAEQLSANGSLIPPAPLVAKLSMGSGNVAGSLAVHTIASRTLWAIKLAHAKAIALLVAAIVLVGGAALLVAHAGQEHFARRVIASVPAIQAASPQLTTTAPAINSLLTFITLDATDLDAREALRRIAQQAKVKMTLWPASLWSGENGDQSYQVTLHLNRVPFWTAMANLCGQTLSIPRSTQNPSIIQIASAGGDESNAHLGGVWSVDGPFSVVAKSIQRNRLVALANNHQSRDDFLALDVYIDPATTLIRYGTPQLTKSEDNLGHSVLSSDPIVDQTSDEPWTPQGWYFHDSVPLHFQPPMASRLSIVEGHFKATVAISSTAMSVPDVTAAINQPLTGGGRTLTLIVAHFQDRNGHIEFTYFADPKTGLSDSDLLNEATTNITLIDANGKSLALETLGSISMGHGQFQCDVSAEATIRLPVRLSWKIVTQWQKIDVPFSFHDLPLPTD